MRRPEWLFGKIKVEVEEPVRVPGCPFCGADPKTDIGRGAQRWRLRCHNQARCNIMPRTQWFKDLAGAQASWSRRQ